MKRDCLIFLTALFLSALPCLSYGEEPDIDTPFFACLSCDPTLFKKAEYFDCEKIIIDTSSGSGGFFLGEDAIEWIKSGRKRHHSKGSDFSEADIHSIIGVSYFNHGDYAKAGREFRKAGDRFWEQQTAWIINNREVWSKGGRIAPSRFLVEIPDDITVTSSLDYNEKYYVALFKGGIYECPCESCQCELLYLPADVYNWPKDLSAENNILTATLVNNEKVRLDIVERHLSLEQ